MISFLYSFIVKKYYQGGIVIHHSWWAQIPKIGIFVAFSFIAFSLLKLFPDNIFFNHGSLQSLLLYIFLFMFVAYGLRPVILMLNSYYEISKNEIFTVEGILSFKKRTKFIHFKDISGVIVRSNLYSRLCGIGDIEIGSLNRGIPRMVLHGVKNPEKYEKLIQNAVDKYWKKMG